MRYDACSDTSNEGAGETARNEVTVAKRVEGGGIGAEETAPAHSHRSEDCNGVAVDDALAHHLGNETKRGTNGTKSRNGEGHEFARIESEEPLEDETRLARQERQEFGSLVGFSCISSRLRIRAEG